MSDSGKPDAEKEKLVAEKNKLEVEKEKLVAEKDKLEVEKEKLVAEKDKFVVEKEKFDTARELIRHEDGLIHNRGTWFLVLQGFLFTAFVNGVPLLEKFNGKHVFAISAGLTLIGAVGIYSGYAILNDCWIAFRQIAQVRQWWEDTLLSGKFPPLSGGYNRWYQFIFSAGGMSVVLALIWILLIALLIGGVISDGQ